MDAAGWMAVAFALRTETRAPLAKSAYRLAQVLGGGFSSLGIYIITYNSLITNNLYDPILAKFEGFEGKVFFSFEFRKL